MNKIKNSKKGIALLTTIGLIMILSLLILKSFDISQKYFEKASQRGVLVQLNKTFLDALAILQNSAKDIKDAESLSVLIGIPITLGVENNDFNVAIDISSAGGTININNLILENNSTNEPLYNLLRTLLAEYRVVNANFFMAILLDAIDKDKEERSYLSEAALKSGKFTDGGINSKESFNFLLDYFVANGGDAKIYSAPWFDIIGFWGDGVDFNYMSEPLFELIKKEYNLNSLESGGFVSSYDELTRLSLADKEKLQALGVVFFAPRIFCDINFFYLNRKKSLKFLYDTNLKRVGYIETIF
jgi:hypothetical protein